jgi:hypothetical protein
MMLALNYFYIILWWRTHRCEEIIGPVSIKCHSTASAASKVQSKRASVPLLTTWAAGTTLINGAPTAKKLNCLN